MSLVRKSGKWGWWKQGKEPQLPLLQCVGLRANDIIGWKKKNEINSWHFVQNKYIEDHVIFQKEKKKKSKITMVSMTIVRFPFPSVKAT